jgi:hypothetical protein
VAQRFFDGGLAMLDLSKNNKNFKVICKKLFQPHSLCEQDGKIYVSDSCNSRIISSDKKIIYKLDSYCRGLDLNYSHLFCAQSEAMYFSRMIKSSKNIINMTSAINIINTKYFYKRFIGTSGIRNIHDIHVMSFNY